MTTLTDKGTVFTAEVLKRTMEQARNSINRGTIKPAKTTGMIKQPRQKLETIPEINIGADQWEQYVNTTVMAHNTTYHASLKCTPTGNFHGRIPHSSLDLKFANPTRVITQPTNISKMLDDVNKKYKQKVHTVV